MTVAAHDPSAGSIAAGTGPSPGLVDEVDALFSELADDLLYHGDPDAALRRLLTSGYRSADGERVQGLRELMERLRQRREEELESGDLGGAFQELAQELDEIVAEERAGLESLAERRPASRATSRRREVTDEVVAERSPSSSTCLPPDMAGKVRGLQNYDFTSSAAREHFEEFLERLKEEVATQLVRPDGRRHDQSRPRAARAGTDRCSTRSIA